MTGIQNLKFIPKNWF